VSPEKAGLMTVCTGCARTIRVPIDPLPLSELPAQGAAYSPEILSIDIRFLCPACGSKLKIDARAAGTEAACVCCGKKIRAPLLPYWARRADKPLPPNQAAERAPTATQGAVLTAKEIDFMTRPGE
jgi:hypothetical protein